MITTIFILLAILFIGCAEKKTEGSNSLTNPTEEPASIHFEEIKMECMDLVSISGVLEVVVNSQKEYEELINKRFQKPLNDYWNANYESVLNLVKQKNPGLSDEEYEDLVRQVFYKFYPFRGTENCVQPEIDFSKYTLLGQDANSWGCELPYYNISIVRKGKEYTYRIIIERKGGCDMPFTRNKWVLIPKIPLGYTVKFEKKQFE